MQTKTERFEMRLDPGTLEQVDAWRARQPDVPSRAEAFRRLTAIGLSDSDRKPSRFSDGDKLVTLLLCGLYKHLKIKPHVGIDASFVEDVLTDRQYWALKRHYPGIFDEDKDDPATVEDMADEVGRILEVWWYLERSYKQLSTEDKEGVEKTLGYIPRFPGFSRDHEGNRLQIAYYLINKLDRFVDFKDRDLGSDASPLIDQYRHMVRAFDEIKQHLHAGSWLNASLIVELLDAKLPEGVSGESVKADGVQEKKDLGWGPWSADLPSSTFLYSTSMREYRPSSQQWMHVLEADSRALGFPGVTLYPWIGKNYGRGSRFGVKLLVLGEAHYGSSEEMTPEFTRDVIRDWNHRFFTVIAKVLTGTGAGEEIPRQACEEIRDEIAFYNYIQSFVGNKPGTTPTPDQWKDAHAPFQTVLQKLRPDAVLVLGYELGKHIVSRPDGVAFATIAHPRSSQETIEQRIDTFKHLLGEARRKIDESTDGTSENLPMMAVYVIRTPQDSTGQPVEGIFNELKAGRARMGWSYDDKLDLRILIQKVSAGDDLDTQEQEARACLPFLSIPTGAVLLYPNQPRHGRFSIVEITGPYGYSDTGDAINGDFRSYLPCRFVGEIDKIDHIVPSRLTRQLGVPRRLFQIQDTKPVQDLLASSALQDFG